jgi:hypothetical protein
LVQPPLFYLKYIYNFYCKYNKTIKMKRIVLFTLILISGFSFQVLAQSNLLITPMRVIFDGAKQNQELNLVNLGKDTATFSISVIQYNMKEDGSFVKIVNTDAMKMSAEPFLRIFPRQVTLAPGEPQVIMLQCKRRADMIAGEYHSHLYFRAEKNPSTLGFKKPDQDTSQLSIQLTPLYGLCIPIIIRSGETNVSATLSDLKLESLKESSQYLQLTINRSGNFSTYGDIIVDYLPNQGKQVQIAAIKGVGVYTDINKRNIVIKLDSPTSTPLPKGKLKVRYVTNDGAKKPIVYAVGELDV